MLHCSLGQTTPAFTKMIGPGLAKKEEKKKKRFVSHNSPTPLGRFLAQPGWAPPNIHYKIPQFYRRQTSVGV
jgi:hypothetical protein